MSWRAMTLACLLLPGTADCKGKDHQRTDTTQAALSLLEPVLSALNSQEFGKALKIHGPVLAEEVPYLDEKSKSTQELTRRNATRLLCTTVKGGALDVLRKRIADTPDPQMFVLALHGLSREPDAKRLAASRPELLTAALKDADPQVMGVALRAAALAGIPNLQEVLEHALKSPDEPVRAAGLEVVAQVGLGTLEPLVKEALQNARKGAPYPFPEMYHMLAASDDPGMAAVFRQSLEQTGELAAFMNGTAQSRKPWLRGLLLELAQKDNLQRWSAFKALADWGSETEHDLLTLSVELLVKTPTKDGIDRRRYLMDIEACRDYLGKLAGNEFAWDQRDGMLEFARQRLRAAH